MKRRIFKYPIDSEGASEVLMPRGARILSVEWDCLEILVIWALVDGDEPKVERTFYVAQGGAPLRDLDGFAFVGTAKLNVLCEPRHSCFVVDVFVEPEG